MDMSKEDLDALEHLIDAYGIAEVLSGLSSICSAKAEHVSVNWQDATLGKVWMRRSERLDKLSVDFGPP